MAIKITGDKVKDPPAMDEVFIRRVEITQDRRAVDADPPVYRVDATFQLYGVGTDGMRVYTPSMETISIDDLFVKANGKPKQMAIIDAVEEAIADMLVERGDIDTAVVQ